MSETPEQYGEVQHDDGRTPLAFAIGLAAALAAGGLWALVVVLTSMEIGYAAWAVGLIVGYAMARVTQQRSMRLATGAAVLAMIGLLAGKAFIFASSTDRIAAELSGDSEFLGNAVAWQMYADRSLDTETLSSIDAVRESGDTLSDAVWSSMREQADARVGAMTPEQRDEAAHSAARGVMQAMGVAGGIRAQLRAFDLLWMFLAVGTAYRMLAPAKEQEMPAVETDGQPV